MNSSVTGNWSHHPLRTASGINEDAALLLFETQVGKPPNLGTLKMCSLCHQGAFRDVIATALRLTEMQPARTSVPSCFLSHLAAEHGSQ